MTTDGHPCHFTDWHPPHDWQPAVPDPDNDHVLHLGLATLHCPGVTTASP